MDFDFILSQPAFVIHIEELSPDRTSFFTNNILNAGYTDMRIFEGVNSHKPEVLNECMNEFGNKPLHKDLGRGQIGCLFSHLKLYKHIILNNIQVCTIFEDDVHFHPEWNKLAPYYYNNTPKNYDILFIGNQLDDKRYTNNIPIVNHLSTFCTHAYIITIEGAQKLLTYLLTWDYYSKINTEYAGHPLTGLFCIDIMIKTIQDRMNKGELQKYINWYCWNGTHFQCQHNRLPLTGNNIRNTGLVFQSDAFEPLIRKYCKQIFTNTDNIILPNNRVFIISARGDDIDIKDPLQEIVKLFKNDKSEIKITKDYFEKFHISPHFNKLIITYNYDV